MFSREKQTEEEPIKPRRKEKEDEREWDVKKILVTGFFLIAGVLVALQIKEMFFPDLKISGTQTSRPVAIEKPNIKSPSLNVSSQVDSKIEQIKQNVSDLNAQDVATSSPQVQKVLRDIQGIKDLPANQAKQMCLKVCSGI